MLNIIDAQSINKVVELMRRDALNLQQIVRGLRHRTILGIGYERR
jgi:hypothetical protein